MIQEAHVGIGIAGKEGAQAALASDFVISQFRFLSKLVLVHGNWAYYRISQSALNFIFKSFCWTVSLFWFETMVGCHKFLILVGKLCFSTK